MIDLNDVRPIGPPRNQPHLATSELAARLNERVADLARTLLGEPNRSLSSRSQLRFGNKGSIAVEVDADRDKTDRSDVVQINQGSPILSLRG